MNSFCKLRVWATGFAVLSSVLFGLIVAPQSARADALVLADKNVKVTLPSMPTSEALSITAPGQLTLTVTDLLWPQALQSLSFAISDHDSILAQRTGTGSLLYEISAPGNYFANVYATPELLSGVGLYHLNVSFMPTVVPLPAAAWLLISGIFGVVRLLRAKRSRVARTVVNDANSTGDLPVQVRRASRVRNRNLRTRSLQRDAKAAKRQILRNTPAPAHAFVTNPIVQ